MSPTTDARWDELLADATHIAEDYDEEGWDTVVLDPVSASASERDERFGLELAITRDEFTRVEELVVDDDTTFGDAEVYYLPIADDDERDEIGDESNENRRFALAVERDETSSTAIFVPLTYTLPAARSVFETALVEEELLVHVRAVDAAESEQWITFSHDDPSLFLAESDVRSWERE